MLKDWQNNELRFGRKYDIIKNRRPDNGQNGGCIQQSFLLGEQGGRNMASITIDENICKGCGLCANACPKKVISLSEHRMNANGYFVAEVRNPQNCIGCAFCAIMCPDCAIEVEK